MLFKSFNSLRGSAQLLNSQLLGMRTFASGGAKTFQSGGNFNFPKHNEYFNDKYYDTTDSTKSPYAKNAAGPKTLSEDFVDPNNPFVSENPYIPGGILASYKKRMNLTPQEVIEQSYFDKMRDFTDTAAEYFDVVGKSDRDLMNNTKNYATRLRLKREISFESDFRKKYMTREYGNYDKYESDKNSVSQQTERGEDDLGYDKFMKNHREMNIRLKTTEGEEERQNERENVENLLNNENYADQTMKDRMNNLQVQQDYPEEILQKENELKMARNMELSEIQYSGRISPMAKEELYRLYLKGTNIKDLSLKYGIIPQRVKAVIFQRHLYWNEVYPKLGETHMRMALERELLYAQDFPFVDYGKDLKLMSEIEKGVKLVKVPRSDIDANPPEAVKKRVESALAKMKPKR